MFEQWSEFRRRQRAALSESNRPSGDAGHQARDTAREAGQDTRAAVRPAAAHSPGAAAGVTDENHYGTIGRPLNRQSPFYLGFFGATGAVIALGLWGILGRLSTTLTILVIASFLALALNPIVQWLTKHGIRRGISVVLVFLGVLVLFGLIGYVVVPPVVAQATELTKAAPGYFQHLIENRWIQQIDRDYGIVEKLQNEFDKKVKDPNFLAQVFGGVLGAGKAVANGLFQTFTVLILTLYFLASLPKVKQSAYAMVPATRRPRVISLSEEILRRVGSYAIGQAAIAGVNAIASFIMMTILGIPYPAVLAVVVGFLGLVPMVGATLGAAVVCGVALFTGPKLAIIALVYYVVYQQLENYVVAPKVMKRTVSVPGAVTVVAALIGGTLLGVLGALLAIPVAAGLLLLYEEVLVPRQRMH